jgi:hypothetical protein
VLGLAGALPAAFYVWAGVLGTLFVGEAAAGWLATRGAQGSPLDADEDEDGG